MPPLTFTESACGRHPAPSDDGAGATAVHSTAAQLHAPPGTGDPAGQPSTARIRGRQQLTRFLVVAASNAVVDLGVFTVLTRTTDPHAAIPLLAINTIAVLAALTNSYVWNSRWTFRDRAARCGRARWRQRLSFGAQALANIAINDVGLVGYLTLFTAAGLKLSDPVTNLAKALAMLTATTASFLAMKFLVFRARDQRG